MVVIDKKEVEEKKQKRRVGARVFIQGTIRFHNKLLLAHGQSFFFFFC